ncbi:ATP-dependent DNA helicase [Prochlorococcus sp. MIT 1341]|uniref:ATP-dependent DNA helicase n=1 Tax=Prochlorococcus sp. MIT 1341 TaxID=3096221 RepID=UPI002A759317|nr:AAA family ATPase [Prochlorococcus sp. MIT 1341]
MKGNIKKNSSLTSKLTEEQKIVYKNFKSWLGETGEKKETSFVLSGFAGTGKTFLSTRFLRIAEKSKLCWTVVAPTHKAVGVIRQALENEKLKPTWYPSTIHRLLKLRLKRKGDIEHFEKTEQTSSALEQLGLVLIDEASMINSSLLTIILECAQPFKTRLVFVGDPAQLPPINEEVSPVFSMKKCAQVELTNVVRHHGVVLNLANGFRQGKIPCIPPPYLPIIKSKNEIVGCLSKQHWLEKAQEALKESSYQNNPDGARILCYTNRILEKLVPHARRALHGEMADQLPVLPGEILISRNAIMAPAASQGSQEGGEPDMVLGSNRELQVIDVSPHDCDLSKFGLNKDSNWDVPIIKTQLIQAKAGDLQLELRMLPCVGTNARKLLDATLNKIKIKAKMLPKQEGKPIWRQFFLIRDAFASLGPAAVLTVHRSQGSSFDEVFVAPDVFWPKEMTLRKQLVYVAVSRAKSAVWLVGENNNLHLKVEWEQALQKRNLKRQS